MSAAPGLRHLHLASVEDVLRGEIGELCRQIDRRLGNSGGTAERGTYFWHWPSDTATTDVLVSLHADAAAFLHHLLADETPKGPVGGGRHGR